MADRTVTRAARNADGDIVAIGNPDDGWLQRDAQWAIQDIAENRHRYLVRSAAGVLRPLQVVDGPSGPYLRSQADATEENNLDNLERLDLNPWEVALDSTEIFAIHAALVPHGHAGQVLMMGGDEHDSNMADNNDFLNTRIYDVANNTMIGVNSPEADVFCCGHAYLADGHLLVGGGTEFWNRRPIPPENEGEEGTPDPDPHVDMHATPRDHWSGAIECAIYDNDGTWTPVANMLPQPDRDGDFGGGRWYPTLLTLADGRVLAVGGHPRLSDSRHGAWLPEVYDPGQDSWTYQPGHWIYVNWADVPVERGDPTDEEPQGPAILDDDGNLIELFDFPEGQSRPAAEGDDGPIQDPDRQWNYLYYPRMFVVPEGHVFMASPNDGNCGWYDIETGRPTGPLLDGPAHGGRYEETNTTAVLLPLLPGQDDEYPAHVLFMGNSGPRRISIGTSDANADDGQVPQWLETPPRDWPDTPPPEWPQTPPRRRHGIATLLPTGQVLFSGGINENAPSGLPDSAAVRAAEIYTPGIDWQANQITFEEEGWVTTAEANITRNYHSVALLLPNGRVLTAGSNLNGSTGGDAVKEFALEIFTPAWFHDTQRPAILQAPGSLTYGETFSVHCTRSDHIERIALMRCGSVTHAWDGDQRYVGLNFSRDDQQLTVTAPPHGAVAPPGPYMLWVIAEDGPDGPGLPCVLAPFVILS